jgi:hypothetical protein
MLCNCDADGKKTYHSSVQLWAELKNGVPSGAAFPAINHVRLTICTKCWEAEFTIPIDMRQYFGCSDCCGKTN